MIAAAYPKVLRLHPVLHQCGFDLTHSSCSLVPRFILFFRVRSIFQRRPKAEAATASPISPGSAPVTEDLYCVDSYIPCAYLISCVFITCLHYNLNRTDVCISVAEGPASKVFTSLA